MRAVCGRLEMRYSYSNTIVYNNFVWPDPNDEQKSNIETCAKAVLDARNNHSYASLATLYDPDTMSTDLLKAHLELDAAVEAAYGVDFHGDEEKIVAHLFMLYDEATRKKQYNKSPQRKREDPKSNAKSLKTTVKVKVKIKSGGTE